MLIRRIALKGTGRNTGPNGATRMTVHIRDEDRCMRCGGFVWELAGHSVHHRLPRGQGGSNRLSNLILLCGSATTGCHGYIESHRGEAYDPHQGWLVRRDVDPATVPILCARRGLILLDNDGGWVEA